MYKEKRLQLSVLQSESIIVVLYQSATAYEVSFDSAARQKQAIHHSFKNNSVFLLKLFSPTVRLFICISLEIRGFRI